MNMTKADTSSDVTLLARMESRLYLARLLRGIPVEFNSEEEGVEGVSSPDGSFEMCIRTGHRINALGYWDSIPAITVAVPKMRVVTRQELSEMVRAAIDDVVYPMIGAW